MSDRSSLSDDLQDPSQPPEARAAALLDPAVSDPASPLDRWVVRAGRYVAFLFLAAVAFSFFEIIMRYAFNAPTIWVHETVIALVAVCYAYGGAYALARNSHIRISLIYGMTGPRARKFMDSINAGLTLVFAVGLGYAALLLAEKAWFSPGGELSLDRSGSAWNPPTPAIIKALLLICLLVMAVQAVFHLIGVLKRNPGTPSDAGESR